MPINAERLLSALEPLPFPARLTLTARTARSLADDGTLAPLLTELDGRGPYERRLAALAALVGRDAGFLAERLADPDPVVAGYARRGARELPVPDRAVEAAYDDAPAVLRQRLARLLAAGGRTALAERLVARLHAEWGDAEAARLLPACSPLSWHGSCRGWHTPSTAGHGSRAGIPTRCWTTPSRPWPTGQADSSGTTGGVCTPPRSRRSCHCAPRG